MLAHLRDGAGTDVWVNVGADGAVTPAEEPNLDSDPVSAPPTALSAWSTEPRQPGGRGWSNRFKRDDVAPSRRALLVGGSAIGALALAGGGWALATAGDDERPPEPASSTPSRSVVLPNGQNAPAGWLEQAVWSVEDVADPKPQVDVRDGMFAVLTQPPGTGAVEVVVAGARDGRRRWSKTLEVGEIVTDGPFILNRDGKLIVFVATPKRLLGWELRTGVSFADHAFTTEDASVGFGLLGAWIGTGGRRFYGLTKKGLAPFDIPDKASCFGTIGDRMLVVDSGAQAWKLESGKPEPEPVKLQGPKDATPGGVVAVTDEVLVLAWNTWRNVALRAYDLETLKPRWTTPSEPRWEAYLGTARIAPDQTWATVGNRRVDLTSGKASVIAAKWTPVAISDGFAWGDDGSYILACDRSGELVSGKPTHRSNETVIVVAGYGDQAFATSAAYGTPTLYSLNRAV
ncbi:WD40 repeat domain-containing protein [Dermacoccus abyssi]